MWQGDQLLERLYQASVLHREQVKAGETPGKRKARLKSWLKRSLGEFETTEHYEPVLLERVTCDGYIRERVELSAVPGLAFGAYVLIPDGASDKQPGVFAIHGHGYGSRQICGMLADGSPDPENNDIYKHFAVQLVRKGMPVIVPDVIGFGERRMAADLAEDPNAPSSCYRMSTQLLMLGRTLTGLRVTELQAALAYFRACKEVDSDRIGIIGFSGGSLLAYVIAALDERLKAAVLMGFPNTFKDSIMAVHHCICNYTPGILYEAELSELMGLIAPRPLFLETGDHDPIFPEPGFRQAVKELQEMYREAGAEDKLAYDIFSGVHEVSGRYSFDWLKRQLYSTR